MIASSRTVFAAVVPLVTIVPLTAAPTISQSTEPAGQTHVVRIESEALDEQRTVRIALPDGYDESRVDYPLLVVLDGEFSFGFAPAISRYLARSGAVPPMVVAAIENTVRERDMTPPGMRIPGVPEQGAEAFLDFIDGELIPSIEDRFRVSDLRVIVGHSHGAILACHALATRPSLFDAALAMDTPAHLASFFLVDRLVEPRQSPLRLITGETRFGWTDDQWARLERSSPEGSILARFDIDSETHQWMIFPGMYQGLKLLFKEFGSLDVDRAKLGALEQQFGALGQLLGGAVPIPQSVFRQAIEACLLEARADDAQALLDRMILDYPHAQATPSFAERIEQARRLGPLEETVDSMVHGKRLGAEKAAPFLGVWLGTMTTEGGSPTSVEVSLRIEEGRVVGSKKQFGRGGRTLETELVVIRYRDGKLELGTMNGMNPRGVLLYALKADDAHRPRALEGVMELRGVRWDPPRGMTIPITRIQLTRVEGATPPVGE